MEDEALYDYNEKEKRYIIMSSPDWDEHMKLVENALELDNREVFVKLINTMSSEEIEENLWLIQEKVMDYDAVRCVAAVFAGETKISDVYTFLCGTYDDEETPIRYAASSYASRIIVLLLHLGFSPNIRGPSPCSPNQLPLTNFFYSQGLYFMSQNRKARTSAVTLIVQLFKTPKHNLEAVRLLALHTRELKRDFVNYLKGGRLVEVGALLLVAKSRLLSPSTANKEEKEEHDVGFQSISEMHDFLLQAKASSQAYSHLGVIAIDETLLLLKIFDKIGDKLSTLIHLKFKQIGFNFNATSAAVSLIKDAGFDVPDYAVKPHLSSSVLRFQSHVIERAVDDGKKTAVTTVRNPNNSRLCNNNSMPGSVQEINPACLRIPSKNMLCHHILKRAIPLLGTLKRVTRLA